MKNVYKHKELGFLIVQTKEEPETGNVYVKGFTMFIQDAFSTISHWYLIPVETLEKDYIQLTEKNIYNELLFAVFPLAVTSVSVDTYDELDYKLGVFKHYAETHYKNSNVLRNVRKQYSFSLKNPEVPEFIFNTVQKIKENGMWGKPVCTTKMYKVA